MFSRSNSDPLILSPLNKAKGLTFVIGAPWAFAAPTGPPLALREPQFQNSGLGVQPPRRTALPASTWRRVFWGRAAHFSVAIPVPGATALETAILSSLP